MFDLFGREVLINIEVKTPRDPANRPMYNSDKLIEILHPKLQEQFNANMIDKPAVDFSFISSFDHDWIRRYQAFESRTNIQEQDKAKFIFLYSRKPEDVLPPASETDTWSKGVNCQPSCASESNITRFHKNNQIVGVWIDKAVTKDEGPKLWKELMDAGINMFCTDHPLEAIAFRDTHLRSSN